MFTSSNIQVSHTFIIIGLIAESTLKFINDTRSNIFGNLILKMKDPDPLNTRCDYVIP